MIRVILVSRQRVVLPLLQIAQAGKQRNVNLPCPQNSNLTLETIQAKRHNQEIKKRNPSYLPHNSQHEVVPDKSSPHEFLRRIAQNKVMHTSPKIRRQLQHLQQQRANLRLILNQQPLRRPRRRALHRIQQKRRQVVRLQ